MLQDSAGAPTPASHTLHQSKEESKPAARKQPPVVHKHKKRMAALLLVTKSHDRRARHDAHTHHTCPVREPCKHTTQTPPQHVVDNTGTGTIRLCLQYTAA